MAFQEKRSCIRRWNNDLKMLKEVGTGVAMENAIPSLKEAADYVTLSNDEEGVAKFIEKYVLD